MLQLQKVKLKDKTEGYAYHDVYGIIDCEPRRIYLYDANTGEEYSYGDLYVKKGVNNYESIEDIRKVTDFNKMAKNPPYVKKEYSRYYYAPNDDNVKQITLSKIRIEYRDFAVELTQDSKNGLNTEVWTCDGFNEDSVHPVQFYRLKEGMRVYYEGKGTCTVKNIFQLMIDSLVCRIQPDSGGDPIDVKSDDREIYYLPYEEPEHYLKQFNESINELALRPRVDWIKESAFNVYWLPVEGAARYTVSLYRHYKDGSYVRKNVLYKLKDYIVDRNECMLTVDKLYGRDYIIRVSAENRSGEIIAMSRGIDGYEPRWWNL